MALIKCPECEKEISDKVDACPDCGGQIKNKKRKTPKQKMMYIVIVIGVLMVSCVSFFSYQKSLISDVKEYYNSGKYKQAKESLDKLYIRTGLEDYPQKIEILADVDTWRNIALGEEPHTDFYPKVMTATIANCIVDYDAAQELGIGAELNKIMMLTAQEFANEGYDVEYWLCKNRDDQDNKNMEPLRTEDINRANELIQQVVKDINKGEVDNSTNKRIKEMEKMYNEDHPIQVTNDDCAITKDNEYYYCNGTVRNVSNLTYYYVKVKVTYFDENKNVLTTDWVYAVDSIGIKGGENQQFEIMTKVDGSVKLFKVEVVEWEKE